MDGKQSSYFKLGSELNSSDANVTLAINEKNSLLYRIFPLLNIFLRMDNNYDVSSDDNDCS